jgi:hypothetical protein
MYTLTDEDLKSIKAAFGADQPSINGVGITDLIIELSKINISNAVSAFIAEEPIEEAPITDVTD